MTNAAFPPLGPAAPIATFPSIGLEPLAQETHCGGHGHPTLTSTEDETRRWLTCCWCWGEDRISPGHPANYRPPVGKEADGRDTGWTPQAINSQLTTYLPFENLEKSKGPKTAG